MSERCSGSYDARCDGFGRHPASLRAESIGAHVCSEGVAAYGDPEGWGSLRGVPGVETRIDGTTCLRGRPVGIPQRDPRC